MGCAFELYAVGTTVFGLKTSSRTGFAQAELRIKGRLRKAAIDCDRRWRTGNSIDDQLPRTSSESPENVIGAPVNTSRADQHASGRNREHLLVQDFLLHGQVPATRPGPPRRQIHQHFQPYQEHAGAGAWISGCTLETNRCWQDADEGDHAWWRPVSEPESKSGRT